MSSSVCAKGCSIFRDILADTSTCGSNEKSTMRALMEVAVGDERFDRYYRRIR